MKVYGNASPDRSQCIDWQTAETLGLTGRHTTHYDLITSFTINGQNILFKKYDEELFRDCGVCIFSKWITVRYPDEHIENTP